MTSTLLELLLLSQAEAPDNPPAGAMEPPLSASSAGRLLLFPMGVGAVRPEAFASVGLGVDNAR